MLTLEKMANRVAAKIQKSDANYLTDIKNWIDERYGQLYRKKNWPAILRADESGVTTTSGSAELILPKYMDEILLVTERTNNQALFQSDPFTMWNTFASNIDTAGVPTSFYPYGTVQYKAQPAAAERLQVFSSSASDLTQTAHLHFKVDGAEITEELSLSGTTPVLTTATCDANGFVSASKSEDTAGKITVEGATSNTDFVCLCPEDFTAYYQRIRLRNVPNAAITMTVIYKKVRRRLAEDEDTPEFDCSEALIVGAYADALYEQRQHGKAQIQEAKFGQAIEDLWFKQVGQRQGVEMTAPYIDRTQRGVRYA